MEEPIIRAMQPQDAAAVANLCLDLGYRASQLQVEQRFAAIAARADSAVWVAERAGEVVGWLHGHEVRRLESEAYVDVGGLVVANACQGQGIGKRLLAACEAWAAARGYTRIRLRSSLHRVEAHAFYRHVGYRQTKTSHAFERDLPATGG